MTLSIVFTVFVLAQVATPAPPVSIASTIDWFRTQHRNVVVADMGEYLMQVEFAPASGKNDADTLYLVTFAKPAGVAQKLGVDSAELVALFAQAKAQAKDAAPLAIKSCGPGFGDDKCDFYSPINQVHLMGNRIDDKARQHYLQLLAELLGTVKAPAAPMGLRVIR